LAFRTKRTLLKRKFVTNLALVLLLNLLIKPFWILGIDRSVQNAVGAEQYGLYFALFNFSLILNILLDLGITSFNNRNISQNSKLLNKHFSNIIAIRLMLGVAYFIISIGIAWLRNYQLDDLKLLAFLVFNQFLLSFILYLRSNIAGLHLFKTDSIISVLDRVLMIAICGVLLWGNVTQTPFKIKWFVFAQTAAYSITAAIAFILVLLNSGRIKLRFDKGFIIAIIKKSYPFAILTLLMASYNRFDAVLLIEILPERIGAEQAGIYAQAFRLLDAASMFSLLFAGLLLPMFSKMIKQKEPIGQLTQLSFILVVVPAVIVATSCVFYRHEIMQLLYHQHIESSSTIFAILMIGFISISTTYIFGTLLTANGSLKHLNIMAVFGVAVNIILNFILIPKLQATGSAIASLTTQTFTALVQVIIAIKIFKFRINYKLLILLLIFAAGVILFGLMSKNLPYNWMINATFMLIMSFVLAFGIGLIKIKDLYSIIKYDK
jgi:O-antigen/teichoic acid export membrane protein